MNLGEYLKQKRLDKNINLSAIAKILNISKSYLLAIENNEYEKIPGKAYTVAFLRSYADYLKLNSDEIVKEYKNQIILSKKPEPIELPKPVTVFNFLNVPKLISFSLVIFISIPLYFIYLSDDINDQDFAITSDIPQLLESEIEEIEVKSALSKLKKQSIENNIVSSETSLVSYENIQNNLNVNLKTNEVHASRPSENELTELNEIISLKAIKSTWIQLRNNKGEVIYSKLMENNEIYNYTTKDNYLITTGNAGNIIVSIGNEVIGKLGEKGEVLDSIDISLDYFSN